MSPRRTARRPMPRPRCCASSACGSNAPSLLAFRAPEGRSTALGEALDGAAAFRHLAFLLFAIVDAERVLKIAELAIGAPVIAQRRAACFDRRVEHAVDCADQPL